MPATIEALFIVLVFVMPGFITVRTKELLVPSAGRPEALQVTLRSVTASLLYLPFWLLAATDLLLLRSRLLQLSEAPTIAAQIPGRPVAVFFVLALILPVSKDLAASAGEGVWIPGSEVSSIDIHQ